MNGSKIKQRRAAAAVLTAIVMALAPSTALAFPDVSCGLSEDKSSVVVIASNDTGTSYRCTASCSGRPTGGGRSAVASVSCNFALGANSVDTIVCEGDSGGPDHFDNIGFPKFVCAPR